MGYLLLGIGTLTAFGIGGAMLHYLVHAIGKAILFMVAGVFITELEGLRDIFRMGGFAKIYPITAALSLFGFMNLVGMPPSPGLWSEWLIVLGLAQRYTTNYDTLLLLAVALMVSLGISAGYSFVTMRRIFYGPLRAGSAHREVKSSMLVSIFVLGAIGFIIFLGNGPIIGALKTSISNLLLAKVPR